MYKRKPSKSRNFPELKDMLTTMNKVKTDKLVSPPLQMQLAGRMSGQPVRTPHDMGPTLLHMHNQQIPSLNPRESLFFQNYVSHDIASRDHQTSLNNVTNTLHQTTRSLPPSHPSHPDLLQAASGKCHVYPPLLVRFDDDKKPVDQFVPINVFPGGEIHRAKGVPDMVLNFHIQSHAITVTTCHIDPEKIKDFELVIWTLYSMHDGTPGGEHMVNVNQFTQLYDQTRYELLRAMSMRGKMIGRHK